MAKDKTAYVCDNCGFDSTKWLGKCPSCGQWNTFKEVRIGSSSQSAVRSSQLKDQGFKPERIGAVRLQDIPTKELPRIDMHDVELNRVLGGGLVPGSIVLLGGDPGIGKSTLTLQTIMRMEGKEVLYVSGEESAHQLKMRAERLNGSVYCNDKADGKSVMVLCETSLEKVFDQIREVGPDLVVIDSIQTMETEAVDSAPGSITQIRECASLLLRYAKTSGVPVILIGHINKEGTIAGPKILEHIVDSVIQFEGDRQGLYRILRSIKNRFGSTSEIGIYEMQQTGLRPVTNPSELLLSDERDGMSGIAISAAVEGMRPFLIETQALVSTAAYGTPQRSATGFDQRRLNMLLAVLEKKVGFKLIQKDVFINIAGGIKVTDMAMDLSVLAAIFSSNVDMPIDAGYCVCGEVGLSGEVRPVSRIEQRISEAEKLGFTDIVIPKRNMGALKGKKFSIKIHPVQKVEEALKVLFG
ncbi:MAG: DNA repair protein RadA [Prevotella sp.]|nr:DNA repair protein RadA [Prevotella sp.]